MGTALLLLGGVSAVVLMQTDVAGIPGRLPDSSLRLLMTGALFAGSGLLVTLSWLGRRSGAHLNPAVTLAFRLTGQLHNHDLAGYVVAQFLGAAVGAGAARLLWGGHAVVVHVATTVPGPGVSDVRAVLTEAGMTALLIAVILGCVMFRPLVHWTPFAVWVTVTVLVWQGAPITGTSLNPARSAGSAVASLDGAHLAVDFVGPLAGAAVVAAVARLLGARRRVLTARLFHDPRHPTSFRSRLPVRGRGLEPAA